MCKLLCEKWTWNNQRGKRGLENLVRRDEEQSPPSPQAQWWEVLSGGKPRGTALPAEGMALEPEKGPCGTRWRVGGSELCQGAGVWLYSKNNEKSLKSVKSGNDKPWWMFLKLCPGQYLEDWWWEQKWKRAARRHQLLRVGWWQGRWKEGGRSEKYPQIQRARLALLKGWPWRVRVRKRKESRMTPTSLAGASGCLVGRWCHWTGEV